MGQKTRKRMLQSLTLLWVILSAVIIVTGISLAGKQDNECVKTLQWPVILMGCAFLIVGILGLIGSFGKNYLLLGIFLVLMVLLLVLLTVFLVFIFRVTEKGKGHSVPNRSYREYSLSEFSGWMQKRVRSSKKWHKIQKCLSSSTVCDALDQKFAFAQNFFDSSLTPLQSGCCKPPTACGFTFVSPTYWISPSSEGADPDCSSWSNDQTRLCYSCQSCKAGLLASLRKQWRKAARSLTMASLGLLLFFLLIWSAYAFFRHRRNRDRPHK